MAEDRARPNVRAQLLDIGGKSIEPGRSESLLVGREALVVREARRHHRTQVRPDRLHVDNGLVCAGPLRASHIGHPAASEQHRRSHCSEDEAPIHVPYVPAASIYICGLTGITRFTRAATEAPISP